MWKVAEVEVKYRPSRHDKPSVEEAKVAANLFRDNWNADQLEYRESVKIMLVDTKKRCMGISVISEGGLNDCHLDLRILLQIALKGNAYAIILCHNHPSGDARPSPHDDKLTKQALNGCQAVGLKMLDHIIITADSYYSYLEGGKM